jgi:hypothetical protein
MNLKVYAGFLCFILILACFGNCFAADIIPVNSLNVNNSSESSLQGTNYPDGTLHISHDINCIWAWAVVIWGYSHVKDQTLSCYAVVNGQQLKVFSLFLPDDNYYYNPFDVNYPNTATKLIFKYTATTQNSLSNDWQSRSVEKSIDLDSDNWKNAKSFNAKYYCYFSTWDGSFSKIGIDIW